MNTQVAENIRAQLGVMVMMLIGARRMAAPSDSSLMIEVNSRNRLSATHVLVRLEPTDTYTVQFFKVQKVRGVGVTSRNVGEALDVYAEALGRVVSDRLGY